MDRATRIAGGLLFGAVVALLARLLLRLVYDAAVYGDRFDTALFVIGTLVVSCILLVAAAASTWSALGGTLVSTGSVVASALGVRLLDGAPSSSGAARLLDELRATLSDGYLDAGAIVLSGALLAIVVIRLRQSGSLG